jgi:DNA-directed RNA polymerase subunit RPC12/RpoP
MVRIIETKPDPSVVKRIACHNCGSTLEYVPADVKTLNFPDYTGNDYHRGIVCPSCSTKLMT